MGSVLGVIGAGGSILTIPILLYFFKIPIQMASTYSFAIVGISAFCAYFSYRKLVNFSEIIFFSFISASSVFLSRRFLLPTLPEKIFNYFYIDDLLFHLLLILMIAGSYAMIKQHNPYFSFSFSSYIKNILIFLYALILGLIIGVIGAGGGFLIIPALVFFMNLSIKQAIASSLLIITINSFFGLIAEISKLSFGNLVQILMLVISSISGMLLGISIKDKFEQNSLKKIFGWFLLILSFILFILKHIF